MSAHRRVMASALLLLGLAACHEGITDTRNAPTDATLLAQGFAGTPVGFASTENTFAGPDGDGWRPQRHPHPKRGGPFGGAFGMGFMGGGLGPDFMTGAGFRAGLARGPFGGGFPLEHCAFEPSSGKLVCGPTTDRFGLTGERWVIWTDLGGNVQRAPDSTTFSMQTHVEVYGTLPLRDSATRTVRHVSDRLVTGLHKGSTQRTVDGTSHGLETVNGAVRAGMFSAEREVADTTRGVIIPVRDEGRTYPIAGTIVRNMRVTVTMADGTSETATWQEVLTYDGSDTATLVITRNGETKTCTVPLPHGRPVCP